MIEEGNLVIFCIELGKQMLLILFGIIYHMWDSDKFPRSALCVHGIEEIYTRFLRIVDQLLGCESDVFSRRRWRSVAQKVLGGEKIIGACDVVTRGAGLSQGMRALVNTCLFKDVGHGLKQGDSRQVTALLTAEQRLARLKGFTV